MSCSRACVEAAPLLFRPGDLAGRGRVSGGCPSPPRAIVVIPLLIELSIHIRRPLCSRYPSSFFFSFVFFFLFLSVFQDLFGRLHTHLHQLASSEFLLFFLLSAYSPKRLRLQENSKKVFFFSLHGTNVAASISATSTPPSFFFFGLHTSSSLRYLRKGGERRAVQKRKKPKEAVKNE